MKPKRPAWWMALLALAWLCSISGGVMIWLYLRHPMIVSGPVTPEERAENEWYTSLGKWGCAFALGGLCCVAILRFVGKAKKTTPCEQLAEIIKSARALLLRSGNDFSWSPWESSVDIGPELDSFIATLQQGTLPEQARLLELFRSNGPIQNVSVSSGWTREFVALAERFDTVAPRLWPGSEM